MDIDLEELKRKAEAAKHGDIARYNLAFWMADRADEIIAEIERLEEKSDRLYRQLWGAD